MPNLHSHAFQRAFAGYTEQRASEQDNFWTWRRVMYDFVAQLTPDQVEAVAAQLYVEMLKAGFTAVAEFHYLHHNQNGDPYDNIAEMSDHVIAAARSSGIAITHLPVFYAHGGFGGQPPADGQRRFVNHLDQFAELLEILFAEYAGDANVRVGIAPHSRRAVTEEELHEIVTALSAHDPTAPIHIHIAEQTAEVDDCVSWSGLPPVAWLFDRFQPDKRWCLVHATHVTQEELGTIAASGAVAGLCPTTEANLGDGLFPAEDYLALNGVFGIGSDSNVSISPIEELRILEYGQRLVHRRRAVLGPANGSVGAHLFSRAALGGAAALGITAGRLEIGCRADLMVLDGEMPVLLNKPGDTLLDAMVFAGNQNPVTDVMVAGQWRVRDRRHPREQEIFERFKRVQEAILGRDDGNTLPDH